MSRRASPAPPPSLGTAARPVWQHHGRAKLLQGAPQGATLAAVALQPTSIPTAETKPRFKLSLLASGADPLLGGGSSRAGMCSWEGLSPGRDSLEGGMGDGAPSPAQPSPAAPTLPRRSPLAPAEQQPLQTTGTHRAWRQGSREPLTPEERRVISNNTPPPKK